MIWLLLVSGAFMLFGLVVFVWMLVDFLRTERRQG